jgi:hypothetical protein
MALRPHILHVVGYTEADHAATADDVIASCKIARRAIRNALNGPDMTQDELVQKRAAELVQEAAVTIDAIRSLASQGIADPLVDPVTMAEAIKRGILDASQLKNNPYGRGEITTRIDSRGACVATEPSTGKVIAEAERLKIIGVIP